MAALILDLCYALRMLRKSPGFAAGALLSLAFGIGANTAIFTLVDRVLLRSLPVQNPARLLLVFAQRPDGINHNFSYLLYKDYRDKNQVFSGLIAHSSIPLSLNTGGPTERVWGQIVSGNFFSVLGVRVSPGRAFWPEEDRVPGRNPVAVLSHGLWQRNFGSDPNVIGRTIVLNGHIFTVIGVAQREFTSTEIGFTADVWVPLMMQAQLMSGFSALERRGASWLSILGRLKDGIRADQAQAAMRTLDAQIKMEHPRGVEEQLLLAPGRQGDSFLPQDLSRPLALLMTSVILILLIACANVANLLLARSFYRQREIGIRLSLGAGRPRLLRQLLTESMLLSTLGGCLGLLLAGWLIRLLVSFTPSTGWVPLTIDVRLDTRVLGFSLLLSFFTGVVFGFVPALQSSRHDLISALKNETARAPGRTGRWGLRGMLVTVQVALSLVLMIGAGLLVKTLMNLRAIDFGVKEENVLLISLELEPNGYNAERGMRFFHELEARLADLPGVRSASLASVPPVNPGGSRASVFIPDYAPRPDEDMELNFMRVGNSYFQALGIRLLRGRDFIEQDGEHSLQVAIINETMARRYWQGQDPIGKVFSFSARPGAPRIEIVGVARDGKYRSLREEPRASFYLPWRQHYAQSMVLHLATSGPPENLIDPARRLIQSLNKDIPISNIKSLQQQVSQALSQERMAAFLSSFFGLMALALAALGLYGVVLYTVARRTHEIGIRMALGARRSDIVKLVVGEAMLPVVTGASIGCAAAFAVNRPISSLLFGVSPSDLSVYALVSSFSVLVALAACCIPVRKATRLDPMLALRYE